MQTEKILSELTRALNHIEDSIVELQKGFERKSIELSNSKKDILQKIYLIKQSLDANKIQRGKEIVYIGRNYNGKNTKHIELINLACSDLVSGNMKMQSQYFCLKDYGRFVDQREDCRYGYVPRHGTIVFKIGLTDAARNKMLSQDDIEDALYYLYNVDKCNL